MKRFFATILLFAVIFTAISDAAAETMPRTSRCETPTELSGTPGKLPKGQIAASFVDGSRLAMNGKWMANAEAADPSVLVVRALRGRSDAETYYMDDDIAALIVDDDRVICLQGTSWYSDNVLLDIYENGELIYTHQFDFPGDGDDDAAGWTTLDGRMLLTDQGTLYIKDMYGSLFACGTDGGGMRKVTDARMADFVYHDGMIYFANLDDTKVYEEVYDETYEEYVSLAYPTLYRMRQDGTAQEKLTDCGVWGLEAQGNIVLYQNIDEGFVFPIFELSGLYFLSGPLYRYDAGTGEHRPLGIESNQYIPTPYGLAAWHNEFNLEPYDVDRADLILYDYDGKPLYRLDAWVVELFGASFVSGENIEFYSYNLYPQMLWTRGITDYPEDEDGEDDVFTTVPLNGGKKIGGVPNIPKAATRSADEDDGPYSDDGPHGDDGVDERGDSGKHYGDWGNWFEDDPDDSDDVEVYPGMFEDGWPAFGAYLNQRMATRTGPGTAYSEEHGTLSEYTEIVVFAKEDSGGTPWVLVEFVKNNKLVRAYTGLKRVDVDDLASLPTTTKKPKPATVSRDTTAYYGPGKAYLQCPVIVAAGTEVLVYGVDRGYALIEYTGGVLTRSWVPVDAVAFRE